MLPKNFKPKKNYDLIRLGKNNDGGYLVEKNSIKKTNGPRKLTYKKINFNSFFDK